MPFIPVARFIEKIKGGEKYIYPFTYTIRNRMGGQKKTQYRKPVEHLEALGFWIMCCGCALHLVR
jgi:hypothetical protein